MHDHRKNLVLDSYFTEAFMKFPARLGQALLLAIICAIGSGSVLAANMQEQGSVCVANGEFDAFSKGASTVEQNEANGKSPQPDVRSESVRFIQIDSLSPVKVSSVDSAMIASISTVGRHRVTISKQADMKNPQEGFRFSFHERGSNELCLSFESFYGTWRLQPQRGSICRCRHT